MGIESIPNPEKLSLKDIRREIYNGTRNPGELLKGYAHLGIFIEQATSLDELMETQRLLTDYPPRNPSVFSEKIKNRLHDLGIESSTEKEIGA